MTGTVLSLPGTRYELIAYLKELATPDPRPIWAMEVSKGFIVGIDQVFHFFFDDHDFDASEIGVTLRDGYEVAAIEAVKAALDRLLAILGDASDDQFVEHALWTDVTAAARQALEVFERP